MFDRVTSEIHRLSCSGGQDTIKTTPKRSTYGIKIPTMPLFQVILECYSVLMGYRWVSQEKLPQQVALTLYEQEKSMLQLG